MHLLMFNLKMDLDDPVLGFASRWVEAISERVERLTVLTMDRGRVQPPPNVRVISVGKERGFSEPRRAAEFYLHCARLLREDRPDACFSHMIPVFSILFAPVARALRIPTLLWYAHGATPREVRVAERLVDRCVTSTPEGFRVPSAKLRVLQQGIDVDRLASAEPLPAGWERTVVSVGRIGPVKRLVEAIEAIDALRRAVPVRLEIFGAPSTADDAVYERDARRRVEDLGLADVVAWHGPVAFDSVSAAYRRGRVFLSLSRSGSLDKTILEAMASGCLPVCNNDAFAAIAKSRGWSALVPGDGVEAVASALGAALREPPAEQAPLRQALREYVIAEHSLSGLVDRIMVEIDQLTERGSSTGARH